MLRRKRFWIFITDVIVWLVAMMIFAILRFYPTYDVATGISQSTVDFEFTLWLGLQAGLILGVIYGLADVLLDQRWLRKRSFGSIIMIKGLFHLMIILVLSIVLRIEAFNKMDIDLSQAQFIDFGTLIILAYTTMVSFMLNFTRQITLKFGPGNLTRFLTGRFHHPKEETRIFMFLDMRDSTTFAEKLGHVKFGELIQDCFSDLTVVENHEAEVYQYVGDEAIIYWDVKKGLNNCNCLHAFFAYMSQLKSRESYYLKHYGVCPEFKAGANIGKLTVTEIGDIKRDISFLGDTMNTAARIQDQCNKYQKDLLISEALHRELPQSDNLKRSFVDSFTLRGKEQTIGIYSVKWQ